MSGTNDNSSTTYKGRNLTWLVATIILDCLILLILAFDTAVEDLSPTRMAVIRASLTVLLPIPVLILSTLTPPNLKAVLVFWRIKDPLPGCRAFSEHVFTDPRIDLEELKKKMGEFPTTERDQNAKWYSLYKQVGSDSSVVDSHKNYLLFRDIAAMSLLLIPIVPISMSFTGVNRISILICAALFLGQYLVTAIAARNTGVRFVQNVLAAYASRKITDAGGEKLSTLSQ